MKAKFTFRLSYKCSAAKCRSFKGHHRMHHVESSTLHGSMLLPLCYYRALCLNVSSGMNVILTVGLSVWSSGNTLLAFQQFAKPNNNTQISFNQRPVPSIPTEVHCIYWRKQNQATHLVIMRKYLVIMTSGSRIWICMNLYPWRILCWLNIHSCEIIVPSYEL